MLYVLAKQTETCMPCVCWNLEVVTNCRADQIILLTVIKLLMSTVLHVHVHTRPATEQSLLHLLRRQHFEISHFRYTPHSPYQISFLTSITSFPQQSFLLHYIHSISGLIVLSVSSQSIYLIRHHFDNGASNELLSHLLRHTGSPLFHIHPFVPPSRGTSKPKQILTLRF